MDLDRVLASKCRTRIIRVLAKNGNLNVMELTQKTNSTYNQINSHLRVLLEEGIIFDKHYGRLRVITLYRDNPKTALLLQALRILETPVDSKQPGRK